VTARTPADTVETARLTLQPSTPEQLLALIEQPEAFEGLMGVPVVAGLHALYNSGAVSPQWLAVLRQAPPSAPDVWGLGFFVVHRMDACVIGSAGYKGPPDAAGMVEIAYGIAPSYEGQGYASEAAAALVAFALDHGARLLRAHTLPVSNASGRILLKCGFRHVGPVVDLEDGTVWRWERPR